jgi:hypothetical protein
MASGKLEMVITADTGKAAQQVSALLRKMEDMGEKLEQNNTKGKGSFDGMGESITGLVTKYASWAMVIKAVNDVLEKQREHLQAINRENSKSAEVSKGYGEALQKVVLSGGGGNIGDVDKLLRSTAGKFALGEGGLTKLTDAYGRIQAKGGDLSQAQRTDLLGETGKMLQLNQGMDATGYAGGLTDIVGASKGQLNATQANAMLRMIQQRGGIGDLGSVAGAHDKLVRTAQVGGISLQDMAALTATVTKGGGEDLLEKMPDVVAKIKYRGEDIEQALNTKEVHGHKVPSGMNVKMQGDFFQRLETLRGLNLKTEQLDKIFPMMARGPGARNAMENLLAPEGQQMLAGNRAFFGGAGVMGTDTAAADFDALQKAVPTEHMNRLARADVSKGEAGRAGDTAASRNVMFREAFQRRLAKQKFTDPQIDAAMGAYDAMRAAGGYHEKAESFGEQAGEFRDIPLVGGAASKIFQMGAAKNVAINGPGVNSDDKVLAVMTRVAESNERMAAQAARPTRPLNADGAAGR